LSWIAANYVESGVDDPVLRVAAEHWLDTVAAKAAALVAQVTTGASLAERFGAL